MDQGKKVQLDASLAKRKLAAIVFADIAGYTALMQKDERSALQILNHFRSDICRLVSQFNGEIVQYYGDGCLLIFNSALEALKYSTTLQHSLKTVPEVPVRIGIHQGDVVAEGGNIFGDNVNIAARIESMSITGSILLSAKVRSELINQPDIKLKSLGTYEFKNVHEPIEVFAYAGEGFPIPKKGEVVGKFKSSNKEKSIAVLPFKNQSSDKEQRFFGEGIAEEIIYGLSQLDNLKVAGRVSSFSFRESQATLSEIAAQLNVTNILDGSIRKAGNRIRVSVQLVNVTDGFQIWTERFDRELEDIFSIQDEIAEKIVGKLKLTLLGLERGQNLISRKTNDVQAYELYLRGRSYLDRRSDIEQALSCFNQAISIDPNFAAAYTSVAYAYFYKVIFDNYAPRDGFPKAAIAIEKALSLDNSIAEAHTMQGLVDFYFHHKPEKARQEYEKSLLLQPKYADTYRIKAYFHVMLQENDLAIIYAEKSFGLDPLSFNNGFSLGDIYHRTRRYQDALRVFKGLALKHPNTASIKIMLGVIHYLMGDIEKTTSIFSLIDQESIGTDLYSNDRFVIAARLGDTTLTRSHLDYLLSARADTYIHPTIIAILYFSLEDNENGIELLQQAIRERDPVLHMVNILPLWDDYKNLPAVQKLLTSWNSAV
ncbi:MAG: hypothetical protein HKN87_22760 [Saprospiraceae bacterium]|nr:hypothetical protein [Saprospiraceae bacterium]